MPIKEYDIDFTTWYDKYLSDGLRDKLAKYNPFKIHDSSIAKPKCYYVAYFKKEYLNEFIGHEDKFTFFPQPERSRMVEYICDQTRFGEGKWNFLYLLAVSLKYLASVTRYYYELLERYF